MSIFRIPESEEMVAVVPHIKIMKQCPDKDIIKQIKQSDDELCIVTTEQAGITWTTIPDNCFPEWGDKMYICGPNQFDNKPHHEFWGGWHAGHICYSNIIRIKGRRYIKLLSLPDGIIT